MAVLGRHRHSTDCPTESQAGSLRPLGRFSAHIEQGNTRIYCGSIVVILCFASVFLAGQRDIQRMRFRTLIARSKPIHAQNQRTSGGGDEPIAAGTMVFTLSFRFSVASTPKNKLTAALNCSALSDTAFGFPCQLLPSEGRKGSRPVESPVCNPFGPGLRLLTAHATGTLSFRTVPTGFISRIWGAIPVRWLGAVCDSSKPQLRLLFVDSYGRLNCIRRCSVIVIISSHIK